MASRACILLMTPTAAPSTPREALVSSCWGPSPVRQRRQGQGPGSQVIIWPEAPRTPAWTKGFRAAVQASLTSSLFANRSVQSSTMS